MGFCLCLILLDYHNSQQYESLRVIACTESLAINYSSLLHQTEGYQCTGLGGAGPNEARPYGEIGEAKGRDIALYDPLISICIPCCERSSIRATLNILRGMHDQADIMILEVIQYWRQRIHLLSFCS